MKIPTHTGRGLLKFNLTPLIDVIFNLIIFFLAASHFAQTEAVEKLRLPEAATGRPERPESTSRLTITIAEGVELFVAGNRVSAEELGRLLVARRKAQGAALEVRIRVDRRVPYRHVEPVLLACARSGVTQVQFAVLPRREDEP